MTEFFRAVFVLKRRRKTHGVLRAIASHKFTDVKSWNFDFCMQESIDMSKQDEDEGSVSDESSSFSSTTNTGTMDGQQSQASEVSLARSETRRVRRTKWLLAGVLCLVVVCFGAATYVLTSNEEHDDFELRVRAVLSQVLIDR